jgi:hypothetical protein
MRRLKFKIRETKSCGSSSGLDCDLIHIDLVRALLIWNCGGWRDGYLTERRIIPLSSSPASASTRRQLACVHSRVF